MKRIALLVTIAVGLGFGSAALAAAPCPCRGKDCGPDAKQTTVSPSKAEPSSEWRGSRHDWQ